MIPIPENPNILKILFKKISGFKLFFFVIQSKTSFFVKKACFFGKNDKFLIELQKKRSVELLLASREGLTMKIGQRLRATHPFEDLSPLLTILFPHRGHSYRI